MNLGIADNPQGATYVPANILHIVSEEAWKDADDVAMAVSAKAIPSPFSPHFALAESLPRPARPSWTGRGSILLYSRFGHLHSHHRSDVDLAEWLSSGGGWRFGRVDGLKSVIRETGPRTSVVASTSGLHDMRGKIGDVIAFCAGQIRFCDDDEEAFSADEPLTTQISLAADRCPGPDLARHGSHILAIAREIEAKGGDPAHAPGAFADRIAAISAIVDFSGAFGVGRASAASARSNAVRIRNRLEGNERAAAS